MRRRPLRSNDKIYLIGGFVTDTNLPSAGVLVYDTKARTWSERRPAAGSRAAVTRRSCATAAFTCWAAATRWRPSPTTTSSIPRRMRGPPRAPLPRTEGSPAAVAFDGRIYAIGGRSGPADFGAVDIYDPATNRWSAGPPIDPRGTAGAVVQCGAIYVFGGESQARHASLGDVLRLSRDGAWEKLAPMPTPRNFARAVTLGDAVYVVGGSPTPEASHASTGSAVVERFRVACKPGSMR